MTTNNPYAPPSVALADAPEQSFEGNERLIDGGRNRPMGNGWKWFAESWSLFKAQPVMWWLAIIVGGGAFFLMALIPIVNFLTMAAMPLFVAGFGVCARSIKHEGSFSVGQVFDGFRVRPGSLIFLGVLYFIEIAVVIGGILAIFGGPTLLKMLAGDGKDPQLKAQLIASFGVTFFIVYFISIMLVSCSIVFSPYLIQEHGVSAPKAMLMSIKGCLKNIPAYFVAIVVMGIASILATIPLGLGWFILFPMLYLMIYASYRDIFIETEAEA